MSTAKENIRHIDSVLHVRGESEYVDDVRPPDGLLQAAVFGSAIAHGKLQHLDTSRAEAADGVVCVLTADDIPGHNRLGPIIEDEVLLAKDTLGFIGQPIAVVVADTAVAARRAARLITADILPLPVVTDPREAHANGDLIFPSRTFESGDVDAHWAACDVIVEGQCDIGGQEHVPLETNRCRAVPKEDGQIVLFASTQSPYALQKSAAVLLGISEHKVEVDVKRLGGGFGGKEDQATHWACMAAIAAVRTQCPVELVLNRVEDMCMTGKRHRYCSDFKMGLTSAGKVLCYEAWHYQDSGAYADLSMPVLERTLLHSTNAYAIPNARVEGSCCRTNLPPNTAFRGFGGPQGMFVIEAAFAKAAEVMGVPRDSLQYRNLLQDGDAFYYGQSIERCTARATWDDMASTFDGTGARERVDAFNRENTQFKRGLAIMPVCFGISFTKTFLNQGSALVHVYTDGSVLVSTGGIEMGQGVSTNVASIAARQFGIPLSRVRVSSTNTTRVANMSPSAASATTDINGNAVLLAVDDILPGLMRVAAKHLGLSDAAGLSLRDACVWQDGKPTELTWDSLVSQAYLARTRLSAYGYYTTPRIHFDNERGQGMPFAYHVYGTCMTEVMIDCLRGRYSIEAVNIVHDAGRPMNPLIDLGQVEGGLAQGLGWMTMEELAFSDDGRCLSHALSTYKLPDAYFMPDDLAVKFLETDENPAGPLGSKAVGEPPLMYGIGAFFALQEAIRAFAPQTPLTFNSPMTPERVLMQLMQTRHIKKSGDV